MSPSNLPAKDTCNQPDAGQGIAPMHVVWSAMADFRWTDKANWNDGIVPVSTGLLVFDKANDP